MKHNIEKTIKNNILQKP